MSLKGMFQKLVMGATTEESDVNKKKMREIFNEKVQKGDDYKILYCHNENFTDALVVKVTTHSNFIVGYKNSPQKTLVVIPVDAKLENTDDAIIVTKDNGAIAYGLGICALNTGDKQIQFVPVTSEPGINKGSEYHVAIIQSYAEVKELNNFFKEGLE